MMPIGERKRGNRKQRPIRLEGRIIFALFAMTVLLGLATGRNVARRMVGGRAIGFSQFDLAAWDRQSWVIFLTLGVLAPAASWFLTQRGTQFRCVHLLLHLRRADHYLPRLNQLGSGACTGAVDTWTALAKLVDTGDVVSVAVEADHEPAPRHASELQAMELFRAQQVRATPRSRISPKPRATRGTSEDCVVGLVLSLNGGKLPRHLVDDPLSSLAGLTRMRRVTVAYLYYAPLYEDPLRERKAVALFERLRDSARRAFRAA